MSRGERRGTLLAAVTLVLLGPFSTAAVARAEVDCSIGLFAAGDEGGIGGTGLHGDESGIGGTGLRGDEDGIGGTGFGGDEDGVGGTGLFGTVTGMGSVCVNGLEIEYAPEVPLTAAGKRIRLDSLGPGHVVWIVADRRDGSLHAQSIALFMEWVGRVEAVDAAARTIRVDDEIVDVPEGAVVLGRRFEPLVLRLGSHVAVSGLRRPNGRLTASRIDPARPDAQAIPVRLAELLPASPELRWLSVEGFLATATSNPSPALSGLTVDTAGRDARGRVWARGELIGGVLRTERIVPQGSVPGDEVLPRGDMGSRPQPRTGAKGLGSKTPKKPAPKPRPAPDAPEIPRLPIDDPLPELRDIPEIQDVPLEPDRLDVFEGARSR